MCYPLYYQNRLLKKSKLSPCSVLCSMSNGPGPTATTFMYIFSEEITGRNVPRSEIGLLRIINDIHDIEPTIFRTVGDNDCDSQTYEPNYNKSMDLMMKKVAVKYLSPEENPTNSMFLHLKVIYRKFSRKVS